MITTIYSLFDHASANKQTYMYEGDGVSSFDSYFANISDQHEISTLIIIT